jgi:hypothetical protein
MRLYITAEYGTEDLQLVFLLKNVFGVVFGTYRVLTLVMNKESSLLIHKEADSDHTPQANRQESMIIKNPVFDDTEESADMQTLVNEQHKEDMPLANLSPEGRHKSTGDSDTAYVPQQDTDHILVNVASPHIEEKDECSLHRSHPECVNVHSSAVMSRNKTEAFLIISSPYIRETDDSQPGLLSTGNTEAMMFTTPQTKDKAESTGFQSSGHVSQDDEREDMLLIANRYTQETDNSTGYSPNRDIDMQSAAHVAQEQIEEHNLVVSSHIEEKDESIHRSPLERPGVHFSGQNKIEKLHVISNPHTEENIGNDDGSHPVHVDMHSTGDEATLLTKSHIREAADPTSHPGYATPVNAQSSENSDTSDVNGTQKSLGKEKGDEKSEQDSSVLQESLEDDTQPQA